MTNEDIFVEMSMDNETSIFITRELRVLSGLHKGAALALSNEPITIGSDPNCTVVLLDDGVAPVHISLEWVNGKGWANTESLENPIQNPLQAGPVLLSIVKQGSPWVTEEYVVSEAEAPLSDTPRPPIKAAPALIATQQSQHHIRQHLALTIMLIASSIVLFFLLFSMITKKAPTDPSELAVTSPEISHEVPTIAKDSELDDCSAAAQQDLNKDVLAVVNGKDAFVLMRDGQRVYVGDTVGDNFLSELQHSMAIWRSRRTECKEP